MTDVLERLNEAKENQWIPEKTALNFFQLYDTYSKSIAAAGLDMSHYDYLFATLLDLVKKQVLNPHSFSSFHRNIQEPFNYQKFGIDFMRPLVNSDKTFVMHLENVREMAERVKKKENVILYANHQTEVDPQLMYLVLEKEFPEFAPEIIFVAGDRVLTDPMAVPFSLGCNLLCIYSKRHIDIPPEKKHEKQRHNQKTMKCMRDLLSEGGKCIYVAPSGGRDRPSPNGEVSVAPFDPQSIEMFRLMAKQADNTTHFYPLALVTYDILPPPQTVQSELGEPRRICREGARFAFGKEINMENFPGCEMQDRQAKRIARSIYIWNLVKAEYSLLKNIDPN